MAKKSPKLVLGKEKIEDFETKEEESEGCYERVVLKNNKLQVRINTDPSLGVKKGGRIFRWKDTFEEANLFLHELGE